MDRAVRVTIRLRGSRSDNLARDTKVYFFRIPAAQKNTQE